MEVSHLLKRVWYWQPIIAAVRNTVAFLPMRRQRNCSCPVRSALQRPRDSTGHLRGTNYQSLPITPCPVIITAHGIQIADACAGVILTSQHCLEANHQYIILKSGISSAAGISLCAVLDRRLAWPPTQTSSGRTCRMEPHRVPEEKAGRKRLWEGPLLVTTGPVLPAHPVVLVHLATHHLLVATSGRKYSS